MKIRLDKKLDSADKDPLTVQILQGQGASAAKRTFKVAIGETINLDDETAYDVLSRYSGLFSIVDTKSYKTKTKTGYTTTDATASEA